jgi:putative ABC transport system ATP-binding protein
MEGDEQVLKRKRTGETAAPSADGNGRPALLVAEQVRKVYRTGEIEVEALVDLDLTVGEGEMVAVMGPSGSGKTTLLNCLSGLDDIDGGRVLVAGQDLFAMSDARRTAHRATSMGFIFQAFNLIPVFTAAENVELPLLLGGTPAKEARRRAVQMLERVGLADRVGHRPNELADEPTGNLDTQMATQVVDLLHELNQDGQTIVLVTHDPAIGGSAGRLIRMRDGRLVADQQRPQPDGQPAAGQWGGTVGVEG